MRKMGSIPVSSVNPTKHISHWYRNQVSENQMVKEVSKRYCPGDNLCQEMCAKRKLFDRCSLEIKAAARLYGMSQRIKTTVRRGTVKGEDGFQLRPKELNSCGPLHENPLHDWLF